MNFYQYYAEGDSIENACFVAAQYLISLNFKIIPCKDKLPTSQIRSVNKFRIKPIHEKNLDFFFNQSEEIAILTGDNLEVIDIDCKYDLTGKLYRQLATAIRLTLPDVFDKLVIQKTRTGGYHLFYKCPKIAGNKILAQRPATGDEMAKGERIKTIVETRGEGGYIMVSPTPGYSFIKGDPSEIGIISADERAELLAICESFNQLSTPDLTGISKQKQADKESPWNVFNSTHDWQFIRDELIKAGWETLKEDDDRIFVLRPGAASKSSGAIWKASNILFLFSTSTEFPERKPISPFDVIRYLKYDGDLLKAAKGLAEIGIGKFHKDEGEFYKKNDSGEIIHSLRAIVTWMHEIGIRRYYINEKDFEIVHLIDNKVYIIDNNHLKKIFCDYVHKTCPPEIDEYFLRKIASIFSKESLINLLERLEDKFIKSTFEIAWLFYENSAIKVTAHGTVFYEYNSIPGYIWEKSIIKRKISFSDSECEAKTFIKNISNNNIEPFESAIGYMLHNYKDAAQSVTVIFYDEYFDETKEDREPEGGTGKGVLIKMISKFRTTVIIDGKDFNNQKTFAYQQVGPETEIVAFEDVRRNFDFEVLFSKITDDWTVERKNMHAYTIPFDRSPKIIITSNYPLKGTSKSHMRRRFELEVSSYYNTEKTIVSEFGHRFFTEWNEKEWNAFDNYFIECLQFYLKKELIRKENLNLERSRLIAETNRDFISWIESVELPEIITKEEFLKKFTDKFPDYENGRSKITQKLFTKWIGKYCDWKKIKYTGRNDYNGKMCYRFYLEKEIEIKNENENEDDDTPF